MPMIILMIPRSSSPVVVPRTSATAGELSSDLESLPFVAGECIFQGYEDMILVDQVQWQTDIKEDDASEGRRTVHAPEIDVVKIERKMDRSSTMLTKMALTTQITTRPWEFYFFRPLGNDSATDSRSQTRFMTMKLHKVLISKYAVTLGEDEPRESIELSPAIIEWDYAVTGADQSVGGHKCIKYDMQLGQYSQPTWTTL